MLTGQFVVRAGVYGTRKERSHYTATDNADPVTGRRCVDRLGNIALLFGNRRHCYCRPTLK